MKKWIKDLDRILRGEATRLPALRGGTIDVHTGGLSLIIVLLGLFYGVCMGLFAVLRGGEDSGMQMLASTVKVPALFFLTLIVTFPSLYVFNALVGSRLSLRSVGRLLIASLGVTLAVLASFGTVVAFFTVCTTSYPFMILLNVLVYAVAGTLGLKFLLMTLKRLSIIDSRDWIGPDASPPDPSSNPSPEGTPVAPHEGEGDGQPPVPPLPTAEPIILDPGGPLDRMTGSPFGRHVKTVFRCWVVVFGLVGAQMGWVLRPFIGTPSKEFTWFRARESSFFEAVFHAITKLFS